MHKKLKLSYSLYDLTSMGYSLKFNVNKLKIKDKIKLIVKHK